MKTLIKPKRLVKGDIIATVSPCNGLAGDVETRWKYDLGVSRLQELDIHRLCLCCLTVHLPKLIAMIKCFLF